MVSIARSLILATLVGHTNLGRALLLLREARYVSWERISKSANAPLLLKHSEPASVREDEGNRVSVRNDSQGSICCAH